MKRYKETADKGNRKGGLRAGILFPIHLRARARAIDTGQELTVGGGPEEREGGLVGN